MITVDEIMTRELYTLAQTATLEDAMQLMAEHNIRHIPIVDDTGKLKGLVTQRDVLAANESSLKDAQSGGRNRAKIPLSDIMVRDVATIEEQASARSAALYLERHKYGCLPVVDTGRLTGIVTDSDFVAVAINLLEQIETSGPGEDFDEL